MVEQVSNYDVHLLGQLSHFYCRKVFGRALGGSQAPHHRASASVSKLAAQRKARETAALN
jgi:hypothetical protein